jgi:hypothetical protein
MSRQARLSLTDRCSTSSSPPALATTRSSYFPSRQSGSFNFGLPLPFESVSKLANCTQFARTDSRSSTRTLARATGLPVSWRMTRIRSEASLPAHSSSCQSTLRS